MGYACPVCDVPQRDGEHLANHLAFTAMLREDDHEAWLDEHVPGWGGETPDELAGRATEYAEEAEYDEVFEDTADRAGRRDGDRGHGRAPGAGATEAGPPAGRPDQPEEFEGMAQGVADEAVESVLREARELTEEMYGADGEGEADDGADGEDRVDGADADAGGGAAEGDDAEGNDS